MRLYEANIIKTYHANNNKFIMLYTIESVPSVIIIGKEDDIFETNNYNIFLLKPNKIAQIDKDIILKTFQQRIPNNVNDFPQEIQQFIAHRTVNRNQLYYLSKTKFGLIDNEFKEYFGFLPIDKEDENVIELHDMYIYFPEQMKKNRRESIKNFLTKVNGAYAKKNLDYVVSDKVVFKNLPGDNIGTYHKTPDEIAIDPKLSTNERTFKVLIHEFAHKLWFSFLSDNQKQQFKNIHKEKKREFGLHEPKIQIGDILEYEGDDDSLDGTWKAIRWHGNKLEIRTDDWRLIQYPYNFLKGGFKVTNRKTPKYINKPSISHQYNNNTDMWFPTLYSETNLSEWFAETFTLWLLDQLQGEPKEFFDKIIKGA